MHDALPQNLRNYWTATVQTTDLPLLEVAIALGGGTVTQSRRDADGNVDVIYVMGDGRSSSAPGSLRNGDGERVDVRGKYAGLRPAAG